MSVNVGDMARVEEGEVIQIRQRRWQYGTFPPVSVPPRISTKRRVLVSSPSPTEADAAVRQAVERYLYVQAMASSLSRKTTWRPGGVGARLKTFWIRPILEGLARLFGVHEDDDFGRSEVNEPSELRDLRAMQADWNILMRDLWIAYRKVEAERCTSEPDTVRSRSPHANFEPTRPRWVPSGTP
jgi:hypothetical protein